MNNFRFRLADREDVQSLTSIHNANARTRITSIEQGFLLTEITQADVLANLANYFVAENCDREIVGFLVVTRPQISAEFLNQIEWQDEGFKDKVTDCRHLYLKIVATRPDMMGKGIAQFLYQSLYQQFPNSYISAFIVTQPISNTRSVLFHQKQGFQQIGVFRSKQFLDLQDYESILVFKET